VRPALRHSIYHFAHHKCLTVYFHRVLSRASRILGVPFLASPGDLSELPDEPHLVLSHDSALPYPDQPSVRTSHVIRDPRDIVVSGYFYHRRTDEEWCREPNPDHNDLPDDVSYQAHLNAAEKEEGLIYEMDHVSGRVIEDMATWDYDRPECLEMRFEDIVGNERSAFDSLFHWYGIRPGHARRILRWVQRYSRQGRPGWRALLPNRHIRSTSYVGNWKEHFTPEVKRAFKERYQAALETLGYESSADW